jgi:hypothetical protein
MTATVKALSQKRKTFSVMKVTPFRSTTMTTVKPPCPLFKPFYVANEAIESSQPQRNQTIANRPDDLQNEP